MHFRLLTENYAFGSDVGSSSRIPSTSKLNSPRSLCEIKPEPNMATNFKLETPTISTTKAPANATLCKQESSPGALPKREKNLDHGKN